jgi:hypothetical protein
MLRDLEGRKWNGYSMLYTPGRRVFVHKLEMELLEHQ